jgi:hypothetical protein
MMLALVATQRILESIMRFLESGFPFRIAHLDVKNQRPVRQPCVDA